MFGFLDLHLFTLFGLYLSSKVFSLPNSDFTGVDVTSTFHFDRFTSTAINDLNDTIDSSLQWREINETGCHIRTTDLKMFNRIHQLVTVDKLNLIEYKLTFSNYSYNPMRYNVTRSHRADTWARVSTQHGQTLLSLAFNYGVLSLMTLKFGTTVVEVEIEDIPNGCLGRLDEDDKIYLVQQLLMRDFRDDGEVSFQGDERICHEIINDQSGFAKFSDWCCFKDPISGQMNCGNSSVNEWLQFLYVLLTAIRFGVLAFGPLLFLSAIGNLAKEEVPYTVKLKEPLEKTVMLCNVSDLENIKDIKVKQRLDLRNKRWRDFPKLKESVYNAEEKISPRPASVGHGSITGQLFDANISEYDIIVNYKRLLTENKVPIGFWKTISRSIFYCKLRNVGPFVDCCKQNMFKNKLLCSCITINVPWIKFWRKIGLGLLVIFLPSPYYIRLIIMYIFEYDEVFARKEAVEKLGLHESFENSLVLYFLPTHPLFICIYVSYFLLAIVLAYMARRTEEGRFRKILIGSFTDLKNLSWINVLHMLVSNIIWPFKRYGVVGCLVAVVYWPIAIPLTCVVYVFYCLPTIYLTLRMLFYSKRAFLEKIQKRSKRRYRIRKQVDDSLHLFEMENIYKILWGEDDESLDQKDASSSSTLPLFNRQRSTKLSDGYELDEVDNLNPERLKRFRSSSTIASSIVSKRQVCNWRRIVENIIASTLCVCTLYGILIILSECVGCFVEILVFTMMGIIVNAGTLLKYIALVILVVVYSYDCFNNIEKKYLKLNKALFNEVKGRLKDLEKVTSLPSYLQENRGFKSQELNEQAEYEMPDDIVEKPSRHWFINDLVLFIDNEDMPRIPKKLFEDVCEIRVAGVPGPVYLGLMFAVKQFLKIAIFVGFVFLVILSFGNVYGLSSTNQMIAALAGGSLPLILRTFMEPEKPDVEMGTVSFKSKLDEIIKNFAQFWPIYDFCFEVRQPKLETEDDSTKKETEKVDLAIKEETKCDTNTQVNKTNHCDDNHLNDMGTSLLGKLHRSSITIAKELNNKSGHKESTAIDPAEGDAVGGRQRVVCFEETMPQTEVDLMIILPSRNDELWLEEWSDYDITSFNGNVTKENDVFDA